MKRRSSVAPGSAQRVVDRVEHVAAGDLDVLVLHRVLEQAAGTERQLLADANVDVDTSRGRRIDPDSVDGAEDPLAGDVDLRCGGISAGGQGDRGDEDRQSERMI